MKYVNIRDNDCWEMQKKFRRQRLGKEGLTEMAFELGLKGWGNFSIRKTR